MKLTKITFEGVKGVGSIQLDLSSEQQVFTFIGANGIGKTKLLESLFQFYLLTYKDNIVINRNINNLKFPNTVLEDYQHNSPVIFIASQNRGFIKHNSSQTNKIIGNFTERKTQYLKTILKNMQNDFNSLHVDTDIERWFVTLAQSSNPYQKPEDNRSIEIQTVLKLLNNIDQDIDPEFLEIDGFNRVSLKINGIKRELSHLSTGFTSIIKIIQSIISGYSYFTNEIKLQEVPGIVMIDEIESHLHISWQSKIIDLFKHLFPNTIFYITTHSSLILSQLVEDEVYKLERDDEGIVRSKYIGSPGKAAFIDILKEGFDVDLNKIKQQRMSAKNQQAAKKALLNLLNTND